MDSPGARRYVARRGPAIANWRRAAIPDRPMKIAKAASTYFALVFGAGFVLGALRVPLLVPRIGVRVAELIEMPLMLVVIVLAARHVVRRHAFGPAVRPRLALGLLALALLLLAEFGLVLALQQVTIAQYLAGRDIVAGSAYAIMLVVFALMPAWVGRR